MVAHTISVVAIQADAAEAALDADPARARLQQVWTCRRRIVQEALTNVAKHAAGAPASIVLDWGQDALAIEIRNPGTNPEPANANGTGHDLIGMRERVRMPELDGIEATRRIALSGVRSRVLILTTFDLDEYVFQALQAGASGFLLKDVGRERLIDAVNTIAAGEALVAPTVLERLVTHYVSRPPIRLARPPRLAQLTGREREILTLVGRGLANPEIPSTLFISLPTVKTHIRHILQKLNLRDRVQAVVLAYETGLVTPGTSD